MRTIRNRTDLVRATGKPRNPTGCAIRAGLALHLEPDERATLWAWQADELRKLTDTPTAFLRRQIIEMMHKKGETIPEPALDLGVSIEIASSPVSSPSTEALHVVNLHTDPHPVSGLRGLRGSGWSPSSSLVVEDSLGCYPIDRHPV